MPIRPTDDPEIKSMKGIHLYHYSQSNCSMRIRLLLEEKGLPWTSYYINLDTQEKEYPQVMKWIDRLVNRPSYEAAVTRWFDYVPAQVQG